MGWTSRANAVGTDWTGFRRGADGERDVVSSDAVKYVTEPSGKGLNEFRFLPFPDLAVSKLT